MKKMKSPALILLAGMSILFMAFGSSSNSTGESAATVGLNIGDTGPELTYTSPEGKKIALSSLRGQLVLIDGNGIILSKNLRGDRLRTKLSELQK